MSTKVGSHNISAKIKGHRVAVRIQITHSAELPFPVADYPATAHPLDRIAWIMETWRKHDGLTEINPGHFPVMNRLCEAAMKEIDAVLAKGVTP